MAVTNPFSHDFTDATGRLQADSRDNGGGLSGWGQWRLRWLVSYLIVGGLAAWWFPSLVSGWADKLRQRPLAATGAGLVAVITGFGANFAAASSL